MESKKGAKELIIRAIVEIEFRHALIEDFDNVVKNEGYKLTVDEINIFKSLKVEDWDNITVQELNSRIEDVIESGRITVGSLWIKEEM